MGLDRPIIRADSGFFDYKVAEAALANGSDFAYAYSFIITNFTGDICD